MSRRTQKNVGVIGLGIIGQRVAHCLRRKGFSTFVWNRTPRPFPNFVGSPSEIAELCDFIQIFVSNDEALTAVVEQMKQTLKAHHILLAHCTVAPATMRAVAEVANRRGAQLLDAPFTGSKLAAEKGELVYYIGGDDAAYRRARPVLEASSKQIVEIGEIGHATTIKVATNMITAATVQVAAEALALVHNAGIPLEKFAEAMQGNGSNSGTLTMKLPKMIEGDFETHFSVKHMLKDTEIAARMARSYGVALPATEVARDTLAEEARRGRGEADYSAMMLNFFPDGPPNGQPNELSQTAEQRDLELTEKLEESPAPEISEEKPADEPVTEAQEKVEPTESDTKIEDDVPVDVVAEEESAEAEPEVVAAEKKPEEEENPRRGFLSRIFGKVDY